MKRLFCIALLAGSTCQLAHAENWYTVTGASALEQLVSGASAEIEVKPGVMAIGHYHADGSAEIEAWGETFLRTWKVLGEDQVCYTSELDTNCFRFERNLDEPTQYRASNVDDGDTVVFSIQEGHANVVERDSPADDEGGLAAPSAAEIAAALSNPNSTLGTMNFQFDHIAYDGDIPGASKADAQRMTFQPSMPYPLSDTSNLFIRPAIPVIFNQDVPSPTGGFNSEGVDLGDIGFDASYMKTLPSGIILIGGVAGTLPTATDDSLGLDQWLLGPEAGIAIARPWGVLGVLASHQWDVAGEDDFDTSITGGQYFYAFNLGGGWQINGSPVFSYNHEASSGNKTTFPLAIGVSKTTLISGRPWKFGVQYWHYVETPDQFGPDFQLRFSVSPVVSLPW